VAGDGVGASAGEGLASTGEGLMPGEGEGRGCKQGQQRQRGNSSVWQGC
jgi:hypothetical protein